VPSYDTLQKRQNDLIRKALEGSLFIAPFTSTAITTLTTSAGTPAVISLTTLPAGYDDLGWIDKGDGLTFGRDIDSTDVESWGSVEPTRRDITKDVTTLECTAQETKRATLELYYGLDLSGVTPTPVTGEVAFPKPSRPSSRFVRALAIAKDGDGADAIYLGRFLPRANVTDIAEQKWSDGDPLNYHVTLTGYKDPTLGYSERYLFGGPGWVTQLVDMGFPAIA